MRGFIDRFDSTIAGWAFDPENPELALDIIVEHEGTELYRCKADLYRGDLEEAFGSGNHGFSFDPSPLHGFTRSLQLSIFAVGSERKLLAEQLWENRALVSEGSDGWLFLNNDSNQVNLRMAGLVDGEKSIKECAMLFASREAMLTKLGIAYKAIIVPEKNVVCAQFFPGMIVSEARPVPLMVAEARKFGCEIIYPIARFMRTSTAFFPKTDTHVNAAGCELILEVLRDELPDFFSEFRLPDSEHHTQYVGNLGNKLTPPRVEELVEYPMPAGEDFRCVANPIPERMAAGDSLRGQVVVIRNNSGRHERLCVFGTSSAYYLLPLLSAQFKETVMVWENTFDYDLINTYQPDCVLWIATERFLPTACNDLRGLPASATQALEILTS